MTLRIQTVNANVVRDNHWMSPSGSNVPVRTLLLEHARIQSESSNNFSSTNYTKEQTTVTSSMTGIIAPDGTETTWFLRETPVVGVHGIQRESSTGTNSNFGFGVFVKPTGSRNHARLYVYGDSGTAGYVHFNLNTTGSYNIVAGSATINSALMEDYGDGWWRLSAFWNSPSIGVTQQSYLRICSSSTALTYTGSTSQGMYIWGWNTQDVGGVSYPNSPISSYISSSNATASREDEVITFTSQSGAPQEVSIYIKGISVAPASNGASAIIQLGSYSPPNPMLGIRASAYSVVGFYDGTGGITEVTSTTADTQLLQAGNQVELLMQFSGSLQVQLFHTKNSGSIVTSSISSVATGTMPSSWGTSDNNVVLAQRRAAATPNLSFAYQNVLVVQGIRSMQQMRDLSG